MGFSLSTLHSPLSTRSAAAAAAALLAASLVLAREWTYGPGLYPDSLHYVTTARSLLAGDGFVNARGDLYTSWPPLYPLLLAAAAGPAGLDPLDVAGPLNALLLGLIVFFAARWLLQRLQSRLLAAWAGLALALAAPLAEASSWILSEPLFLLTAILALLRAEEFLAAGKTRSLLAAAAFAAAAWQTRYVGAALLLFLASAPFFRRGAPLRRKLRDAAAFSAAAGLPMVPWLLRNYLLVGAFFGGRAQFDCPLPQVLREIGAGLWAWTQVELPAAAAAVLIAVVLAAAARSAARPATRRPADPPTAARSAALFSGFVLTYLVVFAAAMVSGNVYPTVRPRFLTPVYIPLLFAAALALDSFLGRARTRGGRARRAAAAVAAAALCLWTAGQAAEQARLIARANAGELDMGFGGPRWSQSETLRYIRENPLEGMIYSNEPRLLTAMHNRGAAQYGNLLPDAQSGGLPEENAAAGQQRLEARLAGAPDGAYAVWFQTAWRDNLVGYGAAWMRVSPSLETVAAFDDDGGIFRVRKEAAPRENPYRAALRAAVAGQRVGESRVGGPGFDVSVRSGDLVYVKQPCTAADVRRKFFLHVYPADKADLPAARRDYDFDNLDFWFRQYGVALEGACLALRPLPDYAVDRIETGQGAAAANAAGLVESGEWRVESGAAAPPVESGE